MNKNSLIRITETEFRFNAFLNQMTGVAVSDIPFILELSEIKYIAISPRLVIDDEFIFILIIDKHYKIHTMTYEYLSIEDLNNLHKQFNLTPIYEELSKFDYDDYYGNFDKIIYPKEHYWKDVFKKDWKLWIRRALCLFFPSKSFYGNFNYNLKSK